MPCLVGENPTCSPSSESPPAPHDAFFALGAKPMPMPGRQKTPAVLLRPGIVGMRGSMLIRIWPCCTWVQPPRPPPRHPPANVCLVGENPTYAPSRHCRDARVYGHTVTAMHEIEYISPIEYTPSPPPSPHVAQLLVDTSLCGKTTGQTIIYYVQ